MLTSLSRFASGFDFAYFTMFPLGIHSVRMSKRAVSIAIELTMTSTDEAH